MQTDWTGSKVGHEGDQRAGEPALGGKTEGVKSFLPEEEGAQWGAHHIIPLV